MSADVTVVRGNSCYEIVQHEVAGQGEATNEADYNDHYLKFSKSIDICKNVLKPHRGLPLCAVCIPLKNEQKKKTSNVQRTH